MTSRANVGVVAVAVIVPVALVLVAVVVIYSIWHQGREAEEFQAWQESHVTDARATITGYFAALAEADVAGVLEYAAEEPRSMAMMTPEIVGAATAAAPVTDLVLDEVDVVRDADGVPVTATVTGRYAIGGDDVDASWLLRWLDEQWLMERITTQVKLSVTVGVLLNGVPAHRVEVEVLPGGYSLEMVDDLPATLRPDSLVVTGAEPTVDWGVGVIPTKEGNDGLMRRIQTSLTDCFEQSILNPEGCPVNYTVDPGTTVHDGTIRYTLVGDTFQDLTRFGCTALGCDIQIRFTLIVEGESTIEGVRGDFYTGEVVWVATAKVPFDDDQDVQWRDIVSSER